MHGKLTNSNGNAAWNQRSPFLANSKCSDDGGECEENGSSDSPFLGPVWQPRACDKSCGEDPDVGSRYLEEITRNCVDPVSQTCKNLLNSTDSSRHKILLCINAVDKCAQNRAHCCSDDLAPELGFWRRSQEVTSLEVLH